MCDHESTQASGDSCVYDGMANQNAMNTVRGAIACYEGKHIRVHIVEVP